jgi:signal transduction histidine kinase
MSAENDDDPGAGIPAGARAGVDRSSHLGFVAHEIRNPLSTALWTSELLGRLSPAERGGARGEKLAAICLRSVGRVRLLVEDHLLCERLDAGGYPVRSEAVPLSEVLAAIRGRWPERAGTLTLPPDQGLAALADRVLLERALDGLLAVAGADDVPVRVEAEARDGRLELRVIGARPGPLEDPGRGSPSDQRGRALALPMARRVARALGGSLAVAGEGYLLAIPAA